MCEPVSATIIAVGAVASAASAYQQQQMANQAADFNAKMAEKNADAAEDAAQQTLEKGQREESNLRKQVARLKGTQRASMGASGVLVDSGSTLDVIQDTQMLGDLDAFILEQNTLRESKSYMDEALNERLQAGFIKSQKRSPLSAAGLSLLGSGASAGATYASYKYRAPSGGGGTGVPKNTYNPTPSLNYNSPYKQPSFGVRY